MRPSKSRYNSLRMERLQIFGFYEHPRTHDCFPLWMVEEAAIAEKRGETCTFTLPLLDGKKSEKWIYHPPEAVRDEVKSINETYIPLNRHYPFLGIWPGDVIRDPKLRPAYCHPALSRRF